MMKCMAKCWCISTFVASTCHTVTPEIIRGNSIQQWCHYIGLLFIECNDLNSIICSNMLKYSLIVSLLPFGILSCFLLKLKEDIDMPHSCKTY